MHVSDLFVCYMLDVPWMPSYNGLCFIDLRHHWYLSTSGLTVSQNWFINAKWISLCFRWPYVKSVGCESPRSQTCDTSPRGWDLELWLVQVWWGTILCIQLFSELNQFHQVSLLVFLFVWLFCLFVFYCNINILVIYIVIITF